MEKSEGKYKKEIFSKVVRAGKRTYFFDVKSTRNQEYYLTITESKKKFEREGRFFYEKHKIFLYQEDFEKFAENFQETIEYIKKEQPEYIEPEKEESEIQEEKVVEESEKDYTDVEFEDLAK